MEQLLEITCQHIMRVDIEFFETNAVFMLEQNLQTDDA